MIKIHFHFLIAQRYRIINVCARLFRNFAKMTLYLTGSPTRFGEDHFTQDNGFLADVKAALAAVTGPGRLPRVLLVSAAPDDKGFTDSVLSFLVSSGASNEGL